MKKKLSKVLSFMLIAMLCIGSTTFASAGTKKVKDETYWNAVEGVYWQFIPSTGTLMIYGEGAMGDYEFDDYYKTYMLKSSLRYPWQNHAEEITKIKICNGITHIGNWAFAGLRAVTKVEIGNTVKDIGDGAFAYCKNIKELSFPDSVKEIGFQSFKSNMNLVKVDFNKVEKIGDQSFYNCVDLYGIVIPETVKEIDGSYPFSITRNIKFLGKTMPTLTNIDEYTMWQSAQGVKLNIYIPKGADKASFEREFNKYNLYGYASKHPECKLTCSYIEYDDTKAKELASNLKVKTSTSKLVKGVKVKASVSGDVKELKDLGYTVKYKYYRSTKKTTGYSLMKETKNSTYKNTAGKKGQKYYYKVAIEVTDPCTDVIYKSSIKSQTPASRTFRK